MWLWLPSVVGVVKAPAVGMGVGGRERAGEAVGFGCVGVGAGDGDAWGCLGLGLGLAGLEGRAPPMVAFSEMMLFEPRTSGCEVVVRSARGWIRLCSPSVMGCVPRMYAPGSRWVVGVRWTGGREVVVLLLLLLALALGGGAVVEVGCAVLDIWWELRAALAVVDVCDCCARVVVMLKRMSCSVDVWCVNQRRHVQ
jgi:hypothetical protein